MQRATWKPKIDPAFDKVIKGYAKHLLAPIGKSCKDGQIGFLDEYVNQALKSTGWHSIYISDKPRVDIDTLADLLGHKDTRMTRRYAHIGPVHLFNAIGRLEESYKAFSPNLAQSSFEGQPKELTA